MLKRQIGDREAGSPSLDVLAIIDPDIVDISFQKHAKLSLHAARVDGCRRRLMCMAFGFQYVSERQARVPKPRY